MLEDRVLQVLTHHIVGNIDLSAQHDIFDDILDLGLELIFMNIFKDAM